MTFVYNWSSAKVLCQEATEILEGVRGRSVKGQDLLARAHICLYAINEPDQLDEVWFLTLSCFDFF